MFKDKIALVTGATSGIGKEIARLLIANGATVIINYGHNDDNANLTTNEFNEYKDKILLIKADISNEDQVKDMFNKVKEKYGRLDFLVNNAGMNIDSMIEDFNINDFKRVLDVNLVGKVICTKYAIPLLKISDMPSIVNISSRLGTKPCSGSSSYCASEAAIINFTEASALELSKYKIRVNAVSPGLTITPLSLSGWTKEELEEQKLKNLIGRLGNTIDIANAVLFLLSNDASYVNGINLNVNGGSF